MDRPSCAACVNLNRERLRGDSLSRRAILYQNVDKRTLQFEFSCHFSSPFFKILLLLSFIHSPFFIITVKFLKLVALHPCRNLFIFTFEKPEDDLSNDFHFRKMELKNRQWYCTFRWNDLPLSVRARKISHIFHSLHTYEKKNRDASNPV